VTVCVCGGGGCVGAALGRARGQGVTGQRLRNKRPYEHDKRSPAQKDASSESRQRPLEQHAHVQSSTPHGGGGGLVGGGLAGKQRCWLPQLVDRSHEVTIAPIGLHGSPAVACATPAPRKMME
jgi:hypothetical protein